MSFCVAGYSQKVINSFQLNNNFDRETGKEGSPEILSAKNITKNAGSMVYLFIENTDSKPVRTENITWEGKDLKAWSGKDNNYQAIWYTARPAEIAPGEIGEYAICLRSALQKSVEFELAFSNGRRVKNAIAPENPSFRSSTIAFSSELDNAWLYLEAENSTAPLPENISCQNRKLSVKWLSANWVNNIRVAEVTPDQPWKRGERVTFIISNKDKANFGVSIRAFSNLSTFGTYGYGDLRRYAKNGLTGYNSFGKSDLKQLEQAASLNMNVTSGSYDIDAEAEGHPALYAYLLMDEPDAHDWGRAADRPANLRLGSLAMTMIDLYNKSVKKDSRTPTKLTIDLTFTPFNYFVYAPLADISNPDIYTNTCGWSVKYVDNHLSMLKRATGSRPFAFTYQSCWEQWSTLTNGWAGKDQLMEKGLDKFVDKKKKPRGFGYNTNADEIAISMTYGLGNGAVALFAYTDATEAGSGMLFHGSDILPENWAAVGQKSREFINIRQLLLPAHPMDWATASAKKIWIKTLLSGGDAALVAVVNENYSSNEKKFTISPTSSKFKFGSLPWLNPKSVYKVTVNGFVPVNSERIESDLVWSDEIRNAAIYLVVPSDEVFTRINAAAQAERQKNIDGLNKEAELRKRNENVKADMLANGERIVGTSIGGYMMNLKEISPATGEQYNAFDAWQEKGTTALGAMWSFSVSQAELGQKITIGWEGKGYGDKALITITDPKGKMVKEVSKDISTLQYRIEDFIPQVTGEYSFKVIVKPTTPVEHLLRISRWINVLSQERTELKKRFDEIHKAPIITATPIHGYFTNFDFFPTIKDNKYNAIDCWEQSGITEFGASWKLEIDKDNAAKRKFMLLTAFPTVLPAKFMLVDERGKILQEVNFPPNVRSEKLLELNIRKQGTYTAKIVQKPTTATEHALRISLATRLMNQ